MIFHSLDFQIPQTIHVPKSVLTLTLTENYKLVYNEPDSLAMDLEQYAYHYFIGPCIIMCSKLSFLTLFQILNSLFSIFFLQIVFQTVSHSFGPYLIFK